LSRVSENGLPSDFESSRQDESKDPKQDFILSEDGERQLVHFLFSLRHRKEVIDRKLARHHAGKLRKTDYHHSRDQLTPEEVAYRLRDFERHLSLILNSRDSKPE
jgi:hypothetical protein